MPDAHPAGAAHAARRQACAAMLPMLLLLGGLGARVQAMDGIALTLRLTDAGTRSIHDPINRPAVVMRHDLVAGRVVASRPLIPDQTAGAACISPDGREAAIFLSDRKAIVVVPIDGGTPAVLSETLDAPGAPVDAKSPPVPRMLDWRAGENGGWIWYASGGILAKVQRSSRAVEIIGRFTDPVWSFALGADRALVRHTKNRLQSLFQFGGPSPGEDWTKRLGLMCALSSFPDGSLFVANESNHERMNVWDWQGTKRATVKINDWAGNDSDGATRWQHFLCAVNHPSRFLASQFLCGEGNERNAMSANAVIYDVASKSQVWVTRSPRMTFDFPAGLWIRPDGAPAPAIPPAPPVLEAATSLDGRTIALHLNPPYLGDPKAITAAVGSAPAALALAAGGRRIDLTPSRSPRDGDAIEIRAGSGPLLRGTVALPAWPVHRAGLRLVFSGTAGSGVDLGGPQPIAWGINRAAVVEDDAVAIRHLGQAAAANSGTAMRALAGGGTLEVLLEPAVADCTPYGKDGTCQILRGGPFTLTQAKDRLVAGVGTGTLDLGPAATAPTHITLTWDGTTLAALRDGTGRGAVPARIEPERNRKSGVADLMAGLGIGTSHLGGSTPNTPAWIGLVHRLALWDAPLAPAVHADHRTALAPILDRLAKRSVVEATVMAVAKPPDPKSLGMYPDATGEGVYEVTRSIAGRPISGRIAVVSWMVINGATNTIGRAKPGDRVTLVLIPWTAAPEGVRQLRTVRAAGTDEDEDLPRFFEAGVRP